MRLHSNPGLPDLVLDPREETKDSVGVVLVEMPDAASGVIAIWTDGE